jgi:hypothetical protein
LSNSYQVIVAQPHCFCANPEKLKDVMLGVYEGLIATVSAQITWLCSVCVRFFRICHATV